MMKIPAEENYTEPLIAWYV